MRLHSFSYKTHEHAFTFVELIVIISIFAVMSAVALFNFQGFRDTTELNNLALDVALEIKTAQTLGVSSFADDTNTSNVKQVFTVLFDHAGGGFVNAFRTYREVSGAIQPTGYGVFDGPSETPYIFRESQLLGGYIDTIEVCDSGGCNALTNPVSISFERPDPEPVITAPGGTCNQAQPAGYANGRCDGTLRIHIVATDDPNKELVVMVEPSGQIHVE